MSDVYFIIVPNCISLDELEKTFKDKHYDTYADFQTEYEKFIQDHLVEYHRAGFDMESFHVIGIDEACKMANEGLFMDDRSRITYVRIGQ